MEYRFDFDDQLPDLPIAFDLDAVGQLFQEKKVGVDLAPEEGYTVRVTKLQDTKYQPSKRCVTTYEMQLEKARCPTNSNDRGAGIYPGWRYAADLHRRSTPSLARPGNRC